VFVVGDLLDHAFVAAPLRAPRLFLVLPCQ